MVSRPDAYFTYSVWISAGERVAATSTPAATVTLPTIALPVLPRLIRSFPASALMPLLLGIDSHQRTLSRRHLLAALQRLFRGALHLGRHLDLDLLELLYGDPIRLQVFLVHPDRIPLPPVLEQRGGDGV